MCFFFLAKLILYHCGVPGFFLYTTEIKETGRYYIQYDTCFATSSMGIITCITVVVAAHN